MQSICSTPATHLCVTGALCIHCACTFPRSSKFYNEAVWMTAFRGLQDTSMPCAQHWVALWSPRAVRCCMIATIAWEGRLYWQARMSSASHVDVFSPQRTLILSGGLSDMNRAAMVEERKKEADGKGGRQRESRRPRVSCTCRSRAPARRSRAPLHVLHHAVRPPHRRAPRRRTPQRTPRRAAPRAHARQCVPAPRPPRRPGLTRARRQRKSTRSSTSSSRSTMRPAWGRCTSRTTRSAASGTSCSSSCPRRARSSRRAVRARRAARVGGG
jgi:hypothetical protein